MQCSGSTGTNLMEFLWVRWYGEGPGYRSGSRYARLHKVGSVPESDQSAFGFLDPLSYAPVISFLSSKTSGLTSSLGNVLSSAQSRQN